MVLNTVTQMRMPPSHHDSETYKFKMVIKPRDLDEHIKISTRIEYIIYFMEDRKTLKVKLME